MKQFDVVIVGAGIVGLTLALRLVQSKISVAVIDCAPLGQPCLGKPSLRVSALNAASFQVLKETGAWQQLNQQRLGKYERMSVWEQDSFGKIQFSAQDVQASELGFIVENASIVHGQQTALQNLEKECLYMNCEISQLNIGQHEVFVQLSNGEAITGGLLVGADGHHSFIRKLSAMPTQFWDYQQQAIVTTIRTELNHDNCARQAFTSTGPLGLLPLWNANELSIVWSQDTTAAESILQLDDLQFSRRLQATMDNQLGHVEVLDVRQAFPLTASYTRQWVKDRIVLIGDAAHRFHPLAGQGANLGIADANALAQVLLELVTQSRNIADAPALRQFERDRKHAAATMIAAMEGFKRLFSGQNGFKKFVRGLGLTVANHSPMMKEKMIKHAMGFDI